jgi:hypothetical protein
MSGPASDDVELNLIPPHSASTTVQPAPRPAIGSAPD